MEEIITVNNRLLGEIPNIYERSNMCVSNEANIIEAIAGYVTDKLESVSSVFKENKSRVNPNLGKKYNSNYNELKKLKVTINEITNQVKFNQIAKIEIPIMLGLNISIYDAVNEITPLKSILEKELHKKLDKLDSTISSFLTDKDFRTSSRPLKLETYDEYDDLKQALNKIVSPNSVVDRRPISELLPNLNSLHHIHKELIDMGHLTGTKYLRELEKISDDIAQKVDVLHEHIENTKDFEVNKSRLNELAWGLEELAKMITVSVSIIHVINQLTISTTTIVEEVNKRKK